ncbi:MAG: RNA methyltransferase [Carboxylicivirga sp.]|nr:RNA methyltransferase [Carboxylicivirga sp.]
MLSKNKQKFILSLSRKKAREQAGVFVGEGHKLVGDLLSAGLDAQQIIATEKWLSENKKLITEGAEIIQASIDEIKKVSSHKSPPEVIGIFKQKSGKLSFDQLRNELCLFLDEVQDPGNLGTIVRLADWFGIKHVICSINCADIYNAKTIQSTMGAISRVNIYYQDACQFLVVYQKLNLPVYGTFLDGNNIYNEKLCNKGLIIMGNEGKGISDEVANFVSHKLLIPSFPSGIPTSESLNVSVATAITCAEFRRQA